MSARITNIKKTKSVGKDVEKTKSLYTVDGYTNECNHHVKQYGGFSRN